MSLRLETKNQRFVSSVSHAPYDSLRELIEALIALTEGRDATTVHWNSEPEEFDFVFDKDGEDISFKVVRYADHRRASPSIVLNARLSRAEGCVAFWRELRQLRRRAQTDGFEANWRRAFPHTELERLTKKLRVIRRPTVSKDTH